MVPSLKLVCIDLAVDVGEEYELAQYCQVTQANFDAKPRSESHKILERLRANCSLQVLSLQTKATGEVGLHYEGKRERKDIESHFVAKKLEVTRGETD